MKSSDFAAIDVNTAGIVFPVVVDSQNRTLGLEDLASFLSSKLKSAKVIVLTKAEFDALAEQDSSAVYFIQEPQAQPTPAGPAVRFVGTFSQGTTYRNGDIATLGGKNWLYAGADPTMQAPAEGAGWIKLY